MYDCCQTEIDERWLDEWVQFGLREFDEYLRRHAAFAAWLQARSREPSSR
jgi:hypothetical protein